MRTSSRTAELAACMRAGAQAYPPEVRRVDDPYARRFVRAPWLRAPLASPRLMRAGAPVLNALLGGMVGETVLRTSYADERLRDAIAGDVRQVVMLGSGYDATCVRRAVDGVRFFEVDHPDTQEVKREILADAAPGRLGDVVFLPCDLAVEDFGDALLAAGFDPSAPAFVNWLAVTWYLSHDAVEATLTRLRELLAPGSGLVLDYLHRDVVEGTTGDRGARRAARIVARSGEPWTFGLDPAEVEPWLATLGFDVVDHATADEVVRRYTDPEAPIGAADFVSLVHAVRAGTPAAG